MSRHSFDPDVAKLVGINAAVIFQNILWWTEKNAANGKHEYEGRFWTYSSVSAFEALFPYLTAKQIRLALDKLEDAGFLIAGNFNQSAYDRTKWYSPICPEGDYHLPKKANENAQKGKPIPDSKPDHKLDIITPYNPPLPDWMPIEAWDGWLAMRKAIKKPLTDRARTRAINKLDLMRQNGQDIAEVLDRSTSNVWTDLYEIKKENWHGTRTGKTDGASAALDEIIRSCESSRPADGSSFKRIGSNF